MPTLRRQLKRLPAGQEARYEQYVMHIGEGIGLEIIIDAVDDHSKSGLL